MNQKASTNQIFLKKMPITRPFIMAYSQKNSYFSTLVFFGNENN